MLEIENLIGVWKSRNFPLYTQLDNAQITLHVSSRLYATLWVLNEQQETQNLCIGTISLEALEHDQFQLSIDGHAIMDDYLNLTCRLYSPIPSPSFVINVPEYGEIYFEKLVANG